MKERYKENKDKHVTNLASEARQEMKSEGYRETNKKIAEGTGLGVKYTVKGKKYHVTGTAKWKLGTITLYFTLLVVLAFVIIIKFKLYE